MYASGLLIFIRENLNCASALSLSHKIWFRLFLRPNLRDGHFPPVIGMHHAIVGCGPANKCPKDIDQGHHCSCCSRGHDTAWELLGHLTVQMAGVLLPSLHCVLVFPILLLQPPPDPLAHRWHLLPSEGGKEKMQITLLHCSPQARTISEFSLFLS